MAKCWRALLLLTTVMFAETFNIDTQKKWSCGIANSLFGQKVMKHSDGSKHWIFVTAPAGNLRSRLFGGVHRCQIIPKQANCACELIHLTAGAGKSSRKARAWPSASLTRNSDKVLTCVQYKSSPFRSVTGELNGQCSLFTKELQNTTYFDLPNIVEEARTNTNANNNNGNRETVKRQAEVFTSSGNVQDSVAQANCNNNNNAGEEEDDDDESRTEIAIVLDGSGSIDAPDFQRAKDFISNMMKTFWQKCLQCEFAVVQYGTDIRTEFDLRESQDSFAALQIIQNIKQVYNTTKTASAIQHVLDSIFNEKYGSKKNAKKIIVVLTDGEILMDQLDLATVINSPQMANIERYVIGVGSAFEKKKALEELQLIASDPDEKHLFRVTNYSALDGLLAGLQQKLAGIEGTTGDLLQFELAEMGFSAQIVNEQVLLFGAVGAFDWSGGIVRYSTERVEDQEQVVFLNESGNNVQAAKYGYLGYSLTLVQGRPKEPLYISGAPRHSNTGQVLVFEKDIHSYHLIHRLQGEQIGSYFGSELCSLDADLDDLTDYLLIGAPFYHIKGEEGRVYVYKFDHRDTFNFTFVKPLSGQPTYTFARFGFSIASIGDLNRDGYGDIAIGAPMEEDSDDPGSLGSVYVYNGCKYGIMEPWSQRIRAAEVSMGLRYFGQSVDGGLDFTDDGNIDIIVGALGQMFVLRSRPVIRLNASVQFTPDQVPVLSDESTTTNTIAMKLCFRMDSAFQDIDIQKSRVAYSLELDTRVEPKRILFQVPKEPRLNSVLHLSNTCVTLLLLVPPCKYDCFTSITISLSYALKVDRMRDRPAPILDNCKTTQRNFELPYMKDCKNNSVCISDLRLDTSFSERELVVGNTKDLTMSIHLVNNGDNSYLTTMLLKYPIHLQFKRILKPSSPSVACLAPTPLTPLMASMSCRIGYPVFGRSSVNYAIIWQVDTTMFPGRTATFDVNITSINEGAVPVTQETSLLVKHSFTAVLSRLRAVIDVNVSQGLSKSKEILYEFNVNGENRYGAEMALMVWIPVEMQGIGVAAIQSVKSTQNSTRCNITEEKIGPSDGIVETKLCNAGICQGVKCTFTTNKEDITVLAELDLEALQQVVEDRTELAVTAEISYDKALYANINSGNQRAMITVMLLKARQSITLPLIIGSTAGGLLLLALIVVIMWKCGFFKRNYKDMRE